MQKYAPSAPVVWFGEAQQEQRRVPSKQENVLDVASCGITGTGRDACCVELSDMVFAALKTELADLMGREGKVLSECTLKPFKTLHIPVNRDIVAFGGPARVDIVRADLSYRGESWHSDVSMKDESGDGIWFGQVRMLFYASYCSTKAAARVARAGHKSFKAVAN